MNKIIILIILLLALVSCDKELSVEVEESIPIENFSLTVNSKPDGIKIFVDDRYTGLKTPAKVNWLSQSIHNVKLVSDYFDPVSYEMNLISEDTTLYHDYYKYSINYSTLFVNSNPLGANIFINGTSIDSTTPAKLYNLLGGKYKVKCTLEDHRSDSLEISLHGNSLKVINLKLRDTTLFVDYNNIEQYKNIYQINSICYYNDELWVSTNEYGILVLGNKGIKNYTTENTILPTQKVNFMKAIDSDLWIGTSLGLIKVSNDTWTLFNNQNAPFIDNYTTSIVIDSKGNYWIGTTKGLLKYKNGSWEIFTNSNSELLNSVIYDLAVDNKDRIWFSTSVHGFGYFDIGEVKYFEPRIYSLFGENSLAIFVDRQNRVWVNMLSNSKKGYPGGLHVLDAESESFIYNNINIGSTHDFLETDNSEIWLATSGGIYKFDSNISLKAQYKADQKTGFKSSKVLSLAMDKQRNLWLGTELGGLTKFKVWKITN